MMLLLSIFFLYLMNLLQFNETSVKYFRISGRFIVSLWILPIPEMFRIVMFSSEETDRFRDGVSIRYKELTDDSTQGIAFQDFQGRLWEKAFIFSFDCILTHQPWFLWPSTFVLGDLEPSILTLRTNCFLWKWGTMQQRFKVISKRIRGIGEEMLTVMELWTWLLEKKWKRHKASVSIFPEEQWSTELWIKRDSGVDQHKPDGLNGLLPDTFSLILWKITAYNCKLSLCTKAFLKIIFLSL